MAETMRVMVSVFKLRIGFAIMLCALAGAAVTRGGGVEPAALLALALSVLIASASAGAMNQYLERDLDALMARTRSRPFVTGRLRPAWYWPLTIAALTFAAVIWAALSTNVIAALFVFLGAFTYGVVYTVWLKRRTWMNIVVGGLSGSFAVLAGAAAVNPELGVAPVVLAVVLFLWTPPHFWSLAYAGKQDYERAGVPMLPSLVDDVVTARVIFGHALLLVVLSLVPLFYGMGVVYGIGAAWGGVLFLRGAIRFMRAPSRSTAMGTFFASLAQLTLLLTGALLDAGLRAF
ncbi:MAG: protoheme IX farnesyltransferase [Gammaproteobacteria bacterium]|nr:heme o synthase [Gammaproteobacteria bacterium]NNM00274.1 protoheme IX farnesyltransferase [Gammaproteobacteria bacterium]